MTNGASIIRQFVDTTFLFNANPILFLLSDISNQACIDYVNNCDMFVGERTIKRLLYYY